MSLNVIGLVSGGKDSFFSLLHCVAHGHRIVALANLHPPEAAPRQGPDGDASDADASDLDSFMYQTVGHEAIPLYAAATGLPLYREAIVGGAVQMGRDYDGTHAEAHADADETESMTRLLRRVCAAHPEANAVSAGALLSTYQRTRVESVAVRLGLVSLAYLWQFPVLGGDYLADLEAAGFDARIIKVASGGLDAALLWTDVASAAGRARVAHALRRLGLLSEGGAGAGAGSLIGEGGEYETLVVAGPHALFRHGALAVADTDRRVVHGGGGTARLQIRRATVVARTDDGVSAEGDLVRQPVLLEPRFAHVLSVLQADDADNVADMPDDPEPQPCVDAAAQTPALTTWCVHAPPSATSFAAATQSVVDAVRQRLFSSGGRVARTLVVLRRMTDFAAFNAAYGPLFGGAPLPPARVTIACGDRLPDGVDAAVFFSIESPDGHGAVSRPRQGLHVQSRSYWAPANIGPYSQAVSVSAVGHLDSGSGGGGGGGGARIVSVAGQIPLVPATMELPAETTPAFATAVALALQHLWRIGVDQRVQLWTGAVAYVPRQPRDVRDTARLVARAWHAGHAWPLAAPDGDADEDDNDDTDGPDLWDRTFDARYAQYGGGGGGGGGGEDEHALPDTSVVEAPCRQPPVFLAEVQELPRAAPVEWHALTGLSGLRVGTDRVVCRVWERVGAEADATETAARPAWTHRTFQTLLRTKPAADAEESDSDSDGDQDPVAAAKNTQSRATRVVCQTVETWTLPGASATDTAEATPAAAASAAVSVRLAGLADGQADAVYVDAGVCSLPAHSAAALPVVPCFSLWSGDGERLAAVVVHTAVWLDDAGA